LRRFRQRRAGEDFVEHMVQRRRDARTKERAPFFDLGSQATASLRLLSVVKHDVTGDRPRQPASAFFCLDELHDTSIAQVCWQRSEPSTCP
jgi:hypothetical protein